MLAEIHPAAVVVIILVAFLIIVSAALFPWHYFGLKRAIRQGRAKEFIEERAHGQEEYRFRHHGIRGSPWWFALQHFRCYCR